MRAPDKITISKYNVTDDGDVVFAWLTNSPDCEPINHPVEYTRTDAFIEKACEFLKSYRRDICGGIAYIAGIIDDETIDEFRNYMKGE